MSDDVNDDIAPEPQPDIPEHTRSDRRLTLRGDDALGWLSSIGFVSEFHGAVAIRFDITQDGRFGYARAQHAAMTLRLGEYGSSHVVFAFVIIEGELHLVEEATGREYTLGPGDAYAFPLSVKVVQTNPTVITKIGISLDSTVIDMAALTELVVVRGGEDAGVGRVVVSLVNSLLATELDVDDERHDNLRAAVEQSVLALYGTVLRQSGRALSPGERLVKSARSLIERHDLNRRFTVASLARELDVSDAYLRRVFRESGSSPLEALTEVRAARARALLAGPAAAGLTQTQIAERAGFTSAASMRRALQRD